MCWIDIVCALRFGLGMLSSSPSITARYVASTHIFGKFSIPQLPFLFFFFFLKKHFYKNLIGVILEWISCLLNQIFLNKKIMTKLAYISRKEKKEVRHMILTWKRSQGKSILCAMGHWKGGSSMSKSIKIHNYQK